MNSQVALVVKNPPASAGDKRDMGLISGLGRSPGEGHGNPLQYSGLENSTDRGAWQATVCGVTKSETWLKWLSTHVLATPWFRLHASTAGGTGLIAGQGTRIPHATWLSQKQILKRGWFGEGPKPEMRTVCRIQRQRGGALRWQRWTWVISSETRVTESAQSRPAGEGAAGEASRWGCSRASKGSTAAGNPGSERAVPAGEASSLDDVKEKTDLGLYPEQDDLWPSLPLYGSYFWGRQCNNIWTSHITQDNVKPCR